MKPVDAAFRILRVNLRKHRIEIADDVMHRYHPATLGVGEEICIFCNSISSLSKEHIIPKWLFEKNTKSKFISSVNYQSQFYNKAVIPACLNCNNCLLSKIENDIIRIIQTLISQEPYFDADDFSNIIRWIEIIDYKTQVYDCRRKYIKYGNLDYSKHYGDLPLSHLRGFSLLNPFKAYDYLRRSQCRITVKSKANRFNSLVIFKTKKPHFNFFAQPDEYIYISFPMCNISIFYFLRERFENNKEACKRALYYIDGVSKS